jgi:hypothetical protein
MRINNFLYVLVLAFLFNCSSKEKDSPQNNTQLAKQSVDEKATEEQTATDKATADKPTADKAAENIKGDRTEYELAKKFAPILKFDRAQDRYGYPISAFLYYQEMERNNPKLEKESSPGIENNNLNSIKEGKIPTYFYLISTKAQVRILYWWFYGMQHSCNNTGIGQTGRHHGDWERVMVILSEDKSKVASVTFWQHGGFYTRIGGPRNATCTGGNLHGRCKGKYGFESDATHPIVYVGKIAHGSYHNSNSLGSIGPAKCRYFADYRNPSASSFMYTEKNLVNLKGLQEEWAIADRKGGFMWGPNGVSTHPNKQENYPMYNMKACKGSAADPIGISTAGCYKSECLSGDSEGLKSCQKECKKGYSNWKLRCKESGLSISSYGVDHYDYDYKLPITDAGLLRRRSSEEEWDLPLP